jgi:hypothetical protein
MLFNNLDGFLNFSTFGYDVFCHQKTLPGFDRKSPPENEFSILFFRKDVPFAQVPGYFLAHDDSAKCGRNDRIAFHVPQFGS